MALTPHDYQKRAKNFWLRKKRAYFAVDMGLGKTLMTLMSLKEIGKPALIIAPVRTIHTTWPEEVVKWGFDFEISIIHGSRKAEALKAKADLYITNFETLPFLYQQLALLAEKNKPMPFEVCVIDEGSKIKAPNTQRFKYLKALRPLFPEYRLILSGTPAPNSLMDLWSQYFWLTDGNTLGKTITAFRNEHFDHVPRAFKYTLKDGHAERIYRKIKPCTFRLDAKDYLKLPDLIKNEVQVELTPKLEKQYKELEKTFFIELNNIEHEAFNKATLSLKLRQFLQGAMYYDTDKLDQKGLPIRGVNHVHKMKLKALESIIDEASGPVLVAIQFRFELDILLKQFPGTPIIAGGVSAKLAAKYVKQWNQGKLPILLCHPASLSHGVNMQTGGNTIVWFGMTWSLEQYLQFNARLHRQGQKRAVVIHHVLCKNTIDYKVYTAIAKKNMSQQALLDYLRRQVQ
jgi:SNF2 family DNA or RNA helicase